MLAGSTPDAIVIGCFPVKVVKYGRATELADRFEVSQGLTHVLNLSIYFV
jgi:hypothetical protein